MKKRIVIAKGEATGHAHVAIGEGLTFLGGVLHAPKGATIIHEEHKEIKLPAGDFTVDQVLEYDHFAEEARTVQD